MKARSLKEANVRLIDDNKAARAKGPQAITIDGKSIVKFTAKKWQDCAGIGEGIVAGHLKSKKKK
jgi:hypothetical protein